MEFTVRIDKNQSEKAMITQAAKKVFGYREKNIHMTDFADAGDHFLAVYTAEKPEVLS